MIVGYFAVDPLPEKLVCFIRNRNAFNAVDRLCNLDSSAAFFFCFIFHVVFALYFLTSSALICSIVNSLLTHCEDNRFVSSDTGTPSNAVNGICVFFRTSAFSNFRCSHKSDLLSWFYCTQSAVNSQVKSGRRFWFHLSFSEII